MLNTSHFQDWIDSLVKVTTEVLTRVAPVEAMKSFKVHVLETGSSSTTIEQDSYVLQIPKWKKKKPSQTTRVIVFKLQQYLPRYSHNYIIIPTEHLL